jgi:hypothetical protein
MINPEQKRRIVELDKPLPDSEDERTQEALELCKIISFGNDSELTTWEMQTVRDVEEGKAATRVRLRELRQIVKRLWKQK